MLAESEPEMMFSLAFFQQPFSGSFHQQKITSALHCSIQILLKSIFHSSSSFSSQ